MTVLHPWDYHPDESALAYAAFRAYRDIGPERSTALVADMAGKSKSLIQRWCTTHRWVERAAAWDAARLSELDELVANRQVAAVRERLEAVDTMRSKALEAVERLDPAKLRAGDAVKLLTVAEQIEATVLEQYEPSPARDRRQQRNADWADLTDALIETLIGDDDM